LARHYKERQPAAFETGLARIIHEAFESATPAWGGRAVFRGVGDAVIGV
jgi:hypothetical protein